MNGEGYLPYSPDHMSITARLDDISNEVTVDGQTITPDSPDEDKVVKPGSMIEVYPGDTVAIYFSDGSVTYLDGDVTGASLAISPRTEVLQNDKNGIITKIRLKLFSGKIWNKVARLAAESEFNVETTAAIAGVRGTEFGIDATTNTLIVLSGTVVAREFGINDDTVTSENEYFEFDNTLDFFTGNQVVTNTSGTAKQFPMPSYEPNVTLVETTSPGLDELVHDKYYKSPFNNNYKPNILEVDTATATKEKIVFEYLKGVNEIIVYEDEKYKTEWTIVTAMINLAETEITIDLSSETNMLSSNGSFEFMFSDENKNETGFSYPAIPLHTGTELSMEDIHNMGGQEVNVSVCTGPFTSILVEGPEVVVVGSTNAMYTATGTDNYNCTQDITSQCTWLVGTGYSIAINGAFYPTAVVSPTTIISCFTSTVIGLTNPPVKIISALNGECWGNDLVNANDDIGYWDITNKACWIMAAEANSQSDCSFACTNQLNGAACVDEGPPNWDDDNKNICLALADITNTPPANHPPVLTLPVNPAPVQLADANLSFAPYFLYDPNNNKSECHSRVVTEDPPNLCQQPSLFTTMYRICKCK